MRQTRGKSGFLVAVFGVGLFLTPVFVHAAPAVRGFPSIQKTNVGPAKISIFNGNSITPPSPDGGGTRCLYAPSESDDAGFRAEIAMAMGGGIVDYYDARYSTPDAVLLDSYNCVFTWTNYAYYDNIGFGNNLADFVDRGGKVILGAFTSYTSGNFLSGRIMNDTSRYSPVVGGYNHFSLAFWDGSDATACIHQGITSYGSTYRDYLTLVGPGSSIVGRFTDGEIANAFNAYGDVIYANGAGGYPLGPVGQVADIVARECVCGPALEVTPGSHFTTTGSGNQYRPLQKTYTLKNIGQGNLTWEAEVITTPSVGIFFTLSSAEGALLPGETHDVTVNVDVPSLNNIDPGTYLNQVNFINLTNGNGTTWRRLTVQVLNGERVNNAIGNMTKQVWGIGGSSYDTVILSNGEYYLTETDLQIPGRGLDFRFTRTYQSHSNLTPENGWNGAGQIGANWDFNYNMRFTYNSENKTYLFYDGAGKTSIYNAPVEEDGSTGPPPGYYDEFRELAIGIGVQLTKKDGTVMRFHKRGDFFRLTDLTDRNGNTMAFYYNAMDNQHLFRVVDTLGRNIDFFYDNDGFLEGIRDYSGRELSYGHDVANGWLTKVTSPSVTYPGNEYPDGKSSQYTYDSGGVAGARHNLLTVTDGRGTEFLSNLYDLEDRLSSQRYGTTDGSVGGTYAYEYVPLSSERLLTRETDRSGNLIEWLMDINMRDITDYNRGHVLTKTQFVRLTPGAPATPLITTYEYNKYGEKIQEILPRGNILEYVYDEANPDPRSRGNLLQTIRKADASDPSPLTTILTYEPRFNLVKTITDARGNTTTNFYDYEEDGLGVDLNDDGIITEYADGKGNLIQIASPVTALPAGHPQGVTHQPKKKIQYNEFGQITKEIEPEGNSTEKTYYASGPMNGYLERIVRDPGGIVAQKISEYDSVGNVVKETDWFGDLSRATEHVVNELNQIQETIGREVTLANGNRIRTRTYTHYDANNTVDWSDVEDWNDEGTYQGRIRTEFNSDVLDNLVRKREQVSATEFLETNYAYDASERQTLETKPEGTASELVYDERDLKIETLTGFGTTDETSVETRFDENGNSVATITGDPGFRKTTVMFYDGYDRRVRTVDAAGNQTIETLDANGNVTDLQQYEGAAYQLARTHTDFDELNRGHTVTTAHFTLDGSHSEVPIGDGSSIGVTYFDENNRAMQSKDDAGSTTTYAYDALDRTIRTTDALNNSVELQYDVNSNVLVTKETERGSGAPKIYSTITTYDALDRPVTVREPMGNETRMTYDSRGNAVKSIDAKGFTQGNRTLSTYDLQNRLLRTDRELRVGGTGDGALDTSNPDNPDGLMSGQFFYDGNGNILERRQDDNGVCPGGCAVTFVYDALDRVTAEHNPSTTEFPAGTVKTYEYDDDGNVVQETDENGTVVTRTFDALNRLAQTDVARAAGVAGTTLQTFVYDGLSRMVSSFDNNDPLSVTDDHTTMSQYDSLGNAVKETQDGLDVLSLYDATGFRTSAAYPGGRTVTFVPDALHRMTDVCDGAAPCSGANRIATHQYIGPNRITNRALGNGTNAAYTYDGDRRATRIKHQALNLGQPIVEFNYQYDAVHNRTKKSEYRSERNGTRTADYTYDSAYRVLSEHFTFSSGRGFLGRVRGALGVLFDSGEADSLPGIEGPVLVSYDGAGNRITSQRGEQLTHYATNAQNQYTAVGIAAQAYDANGNLMTDNQRFIGLSYDFLNRMVAVDYGGQFTTYAYDAAGRRMEKIVGVGPDEQVTRYVHDGSETIEERTADGSVVRSYVYGTRVDDVLAVDTGGQRYTYHTDAQGTVTHVTNTKGALVEAYRYDAFGYLTIMDTAGNERGESVMGNPITFTGRWYDPETGYYFYRARSYDPLTGRFLSRDPKGFVDGMNRYVYVKNNPATLTDAFGTDDAADAGQGASFQGTADAVSGLVGADGQIPNADDLTEAQLKEIQDKLLEALQDDLKKHVMDKTEIGKDAKKIQDAKGIADKLQATRDFAKKHPWVTATVVGGAAVAGQQAYEKGFSTGSLDLGKLKFGSSSDMRFKGSATFGPKLSFESADIGTELTIDKTPAGDANLSSKVNVSKSPEGVKLDSGNVSAELTGKGFMVGVNAEIGPNGDLTWNTSASKEIGIGGGGKLGVNVSYNSDDVKGLRLSYGKDDFSFYVDVSGSGDGNLAGSLGLQLKF